MKKTITLCLAISGMVLNAMAQVEIGINPSPNAILELKAGSASIAPLKLNSGTALTTPVDGVIEYDNSHFWGTVGSTRYQLDQSTGSLSAEYWKNGGNSFGATGSLGTTDNNSIDFISNNTVRGRLSSGGNFLLGTTTDNSTGVLQVNGISSFYNDINLRNPGGNNYIRYGGSSTNFILVSGGNQNHQMSVTGTNGGYYCGLSIKNPTYSTTYHNDIRPDGLMAHAIGQGNQAYYLQFVYNNLVLGSSLTHGMSIKIHAQDGNPSDCSQGDGGSVFIDPGYVQTGCTALHQNGAVLIGSFKNTLVGVNTSTPAYDLDVNGDINCSGLYYGSDARYKKNIQDLENVQANLFQLKSHSYNYRADELKDKRFDRKHHFGFIAQEVEQVFPDLVRKNKEGFYSVNYIEFIPIMLQALKEEDKKVTELEAKVKSMPASAKVNEISEERLAALEARLSAKEAQLASLQSTLSALESRLESCCAANSNKTGGINNGVNRDIVSTLNQNIPNPFNGETVIGFNIVGEYGNAFIGVYDMNGREVSKVQIAKGTNQITIAKGLLIPGMYTYSLIVDKNLVDTKRMVVIEN